MKKRFLSLTLALALSLGLAVPAAAATVDERGALTYTEVISPQYEDAGQFADNGLAAVKKNGKWGYIDTAGQVVIPFRYEMAYIFHEGRAIVCTGKGTNPYDYGGEAVARDCYTGVGFIDEKGNYTPFVADCDELFIWADDYDTNELQFHNGLAMFAPGCWGVNCFFTTDGTTLTPSNGWSEEWRPFGPLNNGLAPAYCPDGSVGWVDSQGSVVKSFAQDWEAILNGEPYISSTCPFNQGLAPVWQATYDPATGETSYRMGLMNDSFQWVIQPQFSTYYYTGIHTTWQLFGETGLAMVEKNGKWGAIDKSGATVIPFRYEMLQSVSDGMIAFQLNGKYGYLDAATLQVAIPAQYEEVTMFNNGLAAVYDGARACLIDKNGAPVPGSENMDVSTYFIWDQDNETPIVYKPEEYVVIEKNGKYGYGHVAYTTLLPEAGEMDAWAYDLVSAAIQADLVPAGLQSLYRYDITRSDFCDMIVQALETMLDKDIRDIVLEKAGKTLGQCQMAYPFTDTTSANVVAANVLGIVAGRGGGIFGPYDPITRQEAAAMLTRTAQVLGLDTANARDAGFADSGQIASFFTDAVNYVNQIKVMTGTSNTTFSPLGAYTREQAYVTMFRLFRVVEPAADPSPAPGADAPADPTPDAGTEPDAPVIPDTTDPAAPAATLANGKPITDDNIREILNSLRPEYPEGMRWTNENSYYSSAMHMTGFGCAGFGLICSDAVFGSLPVSSTHSDFDSIRVGDLLRINHDTHTVVVLEKRANSVVVAEGNYNSSIHWGREISRQSLINGDFVVTSRYPS